MLKEKNFIELQKKQLNVRCLVEHFKVGKTPTSELLKEKDEIKKL